MFFFQYICKFQSEHGTNGKKLAQYMSEGRRPLEIIHFCLFSLGRSWRTETWTIQWQVYTVSNIQSRKL